MSSIYSQSGTLKGSIKSHGTLKATISKPKEIVDNETVFILEDEAGKQVVGVLVDEVTPFDATPNDIRIGKTAVTNEGVTVGEKVIPSYNTTEGVQIIPAGGSLRITTLKDLDLYMFSKLQAIICDFNTSLSDSVSASKVSINNNVYNVKSTESISIVVSDETDKSIDFGITNNTGKMLIIRYFTYKEIY